MSPDGTSGAVFHATRDLLQEVAQEGDVSPERLDKFNRARRRAPALRGVPYFKKIERRAARLPRLKIQVEGLPYSLDARGEHLVDVHGATSEWLAKQFEIFDEQQFKRIFEGTRGVTPD